jgi:hypothetical protein
MMNDPSGLTPYIRPLIDSEYGPKYKKTAKTYQGYLRNNYGWILDSNITWTDNEIYTIYQVAQDLVEYGNSMREGYGKEWFDDNFSGITFSHTTENQGVEDFLIWCDQYHRPTSFTLQTTIYLFPGWDTQQNDPKLHLVHEIGHAHDNIKDYDQDFDAVIRGGGPSTALYYAAGGWNQIIFNPLLFFNANLSGGIGVWDLPEGARWSPLSAYGNNCVADYFAEAFAFTIYHKGGVPSVAQQWMNYYLQHSIGIYP